MTDSCIESVVYFDRQCHDLCVVQGVALKNGSDALSTWKDPPVPVYMKYYVFDVTNAKEVLANRSKPVLVQKGPYFYRYRFKPKIL